MKIFFYLFIAFSVIHGSIFSSYAMMNMTGEVWDYDNSTHRAIYSCPRPNDCRTDLLASYGFPVLLAVVSCCGGLIGSCVCKKCKKCRSKFSCCRSNDDNNDNGDDNNNNDNGDGNNNNDNGDGNLRIPTPILTLGIDPDLPSVDASSIDCESPPYPARQTAPIASSSYSLCQREGEDSENMDDAQKDE